MNEQASTDQRRGARLILPAGYGTASGEIETLPWQHVVNRLSAAKHYWLATVRPDARPHTTPVWGVWIDEALFFCGIPTARWARNLAQNPSLTVHLESGEDVVILEGSAEDLQTEPEVGQRIVEAWDAKYGRLTPNPVTSGMFRLRPSSVRAWTQFGEDGTRWSRSKTEQGS